MLCQRTPLKPPVNLPPNSRKPAPSGGSDCLPPRDADTNPHPQPTPENTILAVRQLVLGRLSNTGGAREPPNPPRELLQAPLEGVAGEVHGWYPCVGDEKIW
jgi:hypothetical protein